MTTHQIEESLPRPSRNVVGRSNQKQTRVKSVTHFADDCEMLRNEEIGTKNPDTSFERFFSVNVKLLMGLGLFSTNFRLSGRLVNTNTRSVLPILFVVSQMIFLLVCELRACVRFWITDPNRAVTALTSLLPAALSAFKGLRLWMCQVKLRELMTYLAILWEKSRFEVNVQQKILKIAERTGFVRSWYIGMMIFIVIGYFTPPYVLLLQFKLSHEANKTYDYSVTGMSTIYPFPIDTFGKHLTCINWEMLTVLFFTLYLAASDTMFVQLVSHTAIHFQVLHCDLKSIRAESKITSAKDEEILLRKLDSIVKRHNHLIAHCKTIQTIYNPIIFVTMISTAMIMCFCVLSVQKDIKNGNYEAVAKNLIHLISVIGQSMMYCGYAENLTAQNFQIAQAAYECQWIERTTTFKINLQIIMMRAQKYYCLSGYGFFQLTLTQITAIVNTTMGYFTILKTMA